MFRKVIHISIALLLFVTTAGFTVSKHFCENRLVSVSLNHSHASCNHRHNEDDCCHGSFTHFQVKDNFILKQISSIPDIPVAEDSVFNVFDVSFKKDNLNKDYITPLKIIPGKGIPILSMLQCYLL